MHFRDLPDPESIQTLAVPFLLQHEAEHCLILGNLASPGTRVCAALDGTTVVAVATHTPPHNLCLSRAPLEAAEGLARHVLTWPDLPGVVGPADVARAFLVHYTRLAGRAAQLHAALIVHELLPANLTPPPAPAPGEMSVVTLADAPIVTNWIASFLREVNEPSHDPAATFQSRLAAGSLFVWQLPDGTRVAMAGHSGNTPTGTRVNLVYTPPAHRSHGYATTLTHALSHHLLNTPTRSKLFLFTVADNRTSNHIYATLGYTPLAPVENHRFL